MPHEQHVACVLLAGGLRPSPLHIASERSVLDLWIAPAQTVLDRWIERTAGVVASDGMPADLLVIHNQYVPAPQPRPHDPKRLIFKRDPRPYRGPAGVARDVCHDYSPQTLIMIAEAARVPPDDLASIIDEHVESGADITVTQNPDHTPAGLYIARAETLELVPTTGYVDIKEQWLPRAVAADLDVRVKTIANGIIPLAGRVDLLRAARRLRDPSAESNPIDAALVRRGDRDVFRVICPGALIERGVTVTDSIVMPGVVIGAGSVVVRSVLLPETRLNPGAIVIDQLVGGERAARIRKRTAA